MKKAKKQRGREFWKSDKNALRLLRRYRVIIAIIILAVLWSLAGFFLDRYLSPQSSYMWSLLIAAALVSFIVQIVKKIGSAALFYGLAALLSYRINDIGATGMNKLVVLAAAAMLFELVLLILKARIKHFSAAVIASTAISAASIPLATGFLLSFSVSLNMIKLLINMALLSLLIGLIGSIISFLAYYALRTTKFLLRFEFKV